MSVLNGQGLFYMGKLGNRLTCRSNTVQTALSLDFDEGMNWPFSQLTSFLHGKGTPTRGPLRSDLTLTATAATLGKTCHQCPIHPPLTTASDRLPLGRSIYWVSQWEVTECAALYLTYSLGRDRELGPRWPPRLAWWSGCPWAHSFPLELLPFSILARGQLLLTLLQCCCSFSLLGHCCWLLLGQAAALHFIVITSAEAPVIAPISRAANRRCRVSPAPMSPIFIPYH